MKKLITSIALLAILPFSAQAAETVFIDDYEDETSGNAPSIGGSNIGLGYGTIQNAIFVGANPGANGNTSSQVFVGAGGTLNPNNVPALFAGGAQPIDGLTLRYDFYSSSAGNHDSDGVRVALVGDLDSDRDVFIRNDRDGAIRLDTTFLGDVNFGADTWQQFLGVFTASVSAGEFNLAWQITDLETSTSISGSQTVTVDGATFTDYKARGILLEVFEGTPAANNFVGYVDNVLVTVPEPATLTLGGFGLLALLTLRRRQ